VISGWEWALIILIVVAVLIWGPKKIPDLARALGQARGEFERATREYAKYTPTEGPATSDDMLIETARKLGISTEGKTKEQISQEIVERAKPKTP
jgi:sec-independent protein translocase protein TatA